MPDLYVRHQINDDPPQLFNIEADPMEYALANRPIPPNRGSMRLRLLRLAAGSPHVRCLTPPWGPSARVASLTKSKTTTHPNNVAARFPARGSATRLLLDFALHGSFRPGFLHAAHDLLPVTVCTVCRRFELIDNATWGAHLEHLQGSGSAPLEHAGGLLATEAGQPLRDFLYYKDIGVVPSQCGANVSLVKGVGLHGYAIESSKKSGHVARVGIFLSFVGLATRHACAPCGPATRAESQPKSN